MKRKAHRNTTHSYSISPHFHHQQHPRTPLLVRNLAKNLRKVTTVLLAKNRLPSLCLDPMAPPASLVLVLDHRRERRRRHITIIIPTRRDGAVSAPSKVLCPCRVNNPNVPVGRQHVIVRNIVVIMMIVAATVPTNRFRIRGRFRTFPRIIPRPHPPHPQH